MEPTEWFETIGDPPQSEEEPHQIGAFSIAGHPSVLIRPILADEVRQRSSGEVRSSRIFSSDGREYHAAGLFSEQIFGPAAGWVRSQSAVSHRAGHVELPIPVFHSLFLRGLQRRVVLAVMGLSDVNLDRLLGGMICVVTNPGTSGWEIGSIIEESEYRTAEENSIEGLEALFQADAARWLLRRADLDTALVRASQDAIDDPRVTRMTREWFEGGQRMDWLVLDVLPVVSPVYRPMRRSRSNELEQHDLTQLYRRVLARCCRIKKLLALNPPPGVLHNEGRRLQSVVDQLFTKQTYKSRSKNGARFYQPLSRRIEKALQQIV